MNTYTYTYTITNGGSKGRAEAPVLFILSRGSWRLQHLSSDSTGDYFSILNVDMAHQPASVSDLFSVRKRVRDLPVILHQQSQAAVVPSSLPQTGEDEQQEL